MTTLTIGKPDHDRARMQGNLIGDPLIAPKNSTYPEGEIVDYYCLGCGSSFAAHDEDSDCWRILKTPEELAEFDAAEAVCFRIRDGI